MFFFSFAISFIDHCHEHHNPIDAQVIKVYENFLAKVEAPESHISEKGVLQIMFDLRFAADVLSGGKDASSVSDEVLPGRRKLMLPSSSGFMEIVSGLNNRLSQRLDPIDWAT